VKVEKTKIPGVMIITPEVHLDNRGFFYENFNIKKFESSNLPTNFVQDNHVRSKRGVLRGLHFQLKFPQGKLIRVTQGSIFDVAVDIRSGSPTFSQYVGYELNAVNKKMFYIPEGFAHGYVVTSDIAEVQYKCTQLFAPDYEYGILWNDAQININWPVNAPILSDKDIVLPTLDGLRPDQLPVYEAENE
jgi:dTDP-4-dehydrorhamnose 3,5-epimerase